VISGKVFSSRALLELVNHAFQVRISGAKASGEPVSAALHYGLAIGQHLKLANLARRNDGFNAQPLFNHGRETRGFGFVVLSRRAGTYLNVHSALQSVASGWSFLGQRYQCKSAVGLF
jgi:hypothetical protein